MLSKEYYKTYGLGCRKMMTTKSGRLDEFPYNKKRAVLCDLPGKHPHPSPSRKRRKEKRK